MEGFLLAAAMVVENMTSSAKLPAHFWQVSGSGRRGQSSRESSRCTSSKLRWKLFTKSEPRVGLLRYLVKQVPLRRRGIDVLSSHPNQDDYAQGTPDHFDMCPALMKSSITISHKLAYVTSMALSPFCALVAYDCVTPQIGFFHYRILESDAGLCFQRVHTRSVPSTTLLSLFAPPGPQCIASFPGMLVIRQIQPSHNSMHAYARSQTGISFTPIALKDSMRLLRTEQFKRQEMLAIKMLKTRLP